MSVRKHESGAAKRKAKKLEQEELKKHPKVTSYFASSSREQSTPREDHDDSVLSTEEKVCSLKSEASDTPDTARSTVGDIQNTAVSGDDTTALKESKPTAEDSELQTSTYVTSTYLVLDRDPAKWPSHISEAIRNYCVEKGPEYFQNNDGKYTASCRHYKNSTRKLTSSAFERILENGEVQPRKWVLYSESTGNVFCFTCKLFRTRSNSISFVDGGFSNWKKAEEKIKEHENGTEHKKATMRWLLRKNTVNLVSEHMDSQMTREISYWKKVLRRVVAVIKFLVERGLPLRGDNETLGSPHNGNFMGILELLSQFDPFLQDHLQTWQPR